VNFFGHALAAAWRGGDPCFALGAMLPDLAGMCRMRLEGVLAADAPAAVVAVGVAYHHETDRVFHGLEPFARGVAEIAAELIARGGARGPARGAAHVAFELCLDGALLAEPGAVRAYLEALVAGMAPEVERALAWSAPDGAERWRRLCATLFGHGLPVEYAVPERVAERVERVLARRPLLAMGPADAAALRGVMPEVAARVARAAPEVLARLRAELV
jgi:hypothetical protein